MWLRVVVKLMLERLLYLGWRLAFRYNRGVVYAKWPCLFSPEVQLKEVVAVVFYVCCGLYHSTTTVNVSVYIQHGIVYNPSASAAYMVNYGGRALK